MIGSLGFKDNTVPGVAFLLLVVAAPLFFFLFKSCSILLRIASSLFDCLFLESRLAEEEWVDDMSDRSCFSVIDENDLTRRSPLRFFNTPFLVEGLDK
jgi:hypothetical protein